LLMLYIVTVLSVAKELIFVSAELL